MKCPKCGAVSGDDWSQCRGSCPMEGSPHFKRDELPDLVEDPVTAKRYKVVKPFKPDPDGWVRLIEEKA